VRIAHTSRRRTFDADDGGGDDDDRCRNGQSVPVADRG
jgi:hypothetical protein